MASKIKAKENTFNRNSYTLVFLNYKFHVAVYTPLVKQAVNFRTSLVMLFYLVLSIVVMLTTFPNFNLFVMLRLYYRILSRNRFHYNVRKYWHWKSISRDWTRNVFIQNVWDVFVCTTHERFVLYYNKKTFPMLKNYSRFVFHKRQWYNS